MLSAVETATPREQWYIWIHEYMHHECLCTYERLCAYGCTIWVCLNGWAMSICLSRSRSIFTSGILGSNKMHSIPEISDGKKMTNNNWKAIFTYHGKQTANLNYTQVSWKQALENQIKTSIQWKKHGLSDTVWRCDKQPQNVHSNILLKNPMRIHAGTEEVLTTRWWSKTDTWCAKLSREFFPARITPASQLARQIWSESSCSTISALFACKTSRATRTMTMSTAIE